MVASQRIEPSPVDALERVRIDLGLTTGELASALSSHPLEVERWRSGRSTPDAGAVARLERLRALNAQLHDTFKTPGAVRWLRSGSRYLGGQPPVEALVAGEIERVEAALEAIDSGIFI